MCLCACTFQCVQVIVCLCACARVCICGCGCELVYVVVFVCVLLFVRNCVRLCVNVFVPLFLSLSLSRSFYLCVSSLSLSPARHVSSRAPRSGRTLLRRGTSPLRPPAKILSSSSSLDLAGVSRQRYHPTLCPSLHDAKPPNQRLRMLCLALSVSYVHGIAFYCIVVLVY